MKPLSTAAAIALLSASCTLGPDFKAPPPQGGTAWKQPASLAKDRVPDTWWRLFGDPKLNALVDRALTANQDLAAARARVETARALVGVDRARLFPTLDLTGSSDITRTSSSGIVIPWIDLERKNYRASFNLAYEPDLWGRNRRQLEASAATAAAAADTLDSQRLGLATEVVRQYLVLRGLDDQRTVVMETLNSRQEALDLQKTKTDAGLTDGLATSSARTELELARHDLAAVDRQRGAAEHALAVLCGSRPSEFTIAASTTPTKLPALKVGPPSTVLLRRPDVRAAELELHAATARIGVAEAAFYPSFNLFGSAGLESLSSTDFLDWESRVLSLGASVAQPVLNQGANRARLEAAWTTWNETLASYRQTLLTALREVEDALVDLQSLARSRAALDAALASARDTRAITQERYDEGLTNYLDVVNADRTVLQTRLAIAQIDAQQRIALAALAKALGGGWSR